MNDTQILTKFVKKVVEKYFYVTLALAMLVIIVNLLVVMSSILLVKKGQQPRSVYLLLGNISLSDLIIGVLSIISLYYRPEYNEDNVMVCIVCLGLYITCTLMSLSSVLLIAIDRYLYIIHGLKYKRLFYPRKIKYIIIGAWMIGILMGIPPLLIWRPHSSHIEICWYTIVATPALILTTSVIGILIIVSVIILYSHILYVAVKNVMQIRRMMKGDAKQDIYTLRFFKGTNKTNNSENLENNTKNETSMNRETKSSPDTNTRRIINDENSVIKSNANRTVPNKWKAVKVVALFTGSFAITWMPYFITSIMLALCDDKLDPVGCERFKILVASPTVILAKINSFLNPVIYAWWHTGFRTAFMKFFLKKV